MNRLHIAALALLSSMQFAGVAHAVVIDMVTVGDPGNADDTTGYGSVGYEYQIGKYEVTIGQYVSFLNAVAATDPYGLYNAFLGSMQPATAYSKGIGRYTEDGRYRYYASGPIGSTPAGANDRDQRPVTFVSWYDTARFANWMSNGQPNGGGTSTTTENGAYNVYGRGGPPTTGWSTVSRNGVNPNTGLPPTFWIPTENEWYKAAYYSPLLNSGAGGYWNYATQSNSVPGNSLGDSLNQANFYAGNLSVTQSASYVADQNYLTNVGAFSDSASFYGTYDQSGNVFELNDLAGDGAGVGSRGGAWNEEFALLPKTVRFATTTTDTDQGGYSEGFRLAAAPVPEPSTWVMGAVGIACGGWQMFRRRRARVSLTQPDAAAQSPATPAWR